MNSPKNLTLILACIAFISVIGAAVYEHIAVVPQWSAGPPLSLSMFQGEYGLNPAPFWQFIHPVTLVLLITSVILNRKNSRKRFIGIGLLIYVTILVITALYFVPELMSIINTPFGNQTDEQLRNRAETWESLSLLRLFVLVITACILLSSLTKSPDKIIRQLS
jgi:hypothetical protein